MEGVVARGISKDYLVTDESDPAEVVAHSKSSGKSVVHGVGGKRGGERQPPTEYYETAEKFNTQSWPGLPKLSKPYNFEIAPGHYDYMAISSLPKATVSDPGSRNHISGAARSLVKKREPGSVNNYTSSSSSSREEPSRSGSGSCSCKASQGRASAHRLVTTRETQAGQIVKQSQLTRYTWDEVEAMKHRAAAASPGGKNEVGGSCGGGAVVLGTGGFGDVYLGMLATGDKKLVAVKVLAETSRQGDLEFRNEVELLSSVNHVNLVKLLGYCQQGSHRVLVYEYAEEGSIHDHLHGKRSSLDWRTRLNISLESACGLEYLHTGCNRRIIHRDIKSNNILLSKKMVAKVADFGMSKMGLEDNSSAQGPFSTAVKGTFGYIDPAYYKTGKLDEKIDIYSFGVVILELITGRQPTNPDVDQFFIGDWVKKKNGVLREIVDSKLSGKYNPKAMKEVYSLALKCIDPAPENRPDIRKVLSHLRAAVEMEHNPLQLSLWKSLWG